MYPCDSAGELVPRHAGVFGAAHVVLRDVNVGVADATELDVKLHIVGTEVVSLDPEENGEQFVGACG